MQIIFIFCIGNANFVSLAVGCKFFFIFCIGNVINFYFLNWQCKFRMFLLFTIGKIFLEKSPFVWLLKSINMDHIWIAFALRVVFAVKIWKKTSMIVWTTKRGPDYHTLPKLSIIKVVELSIIRILKLFIIWVFKLYII